MLMPMPLKRCRTKSVLNYLTPILLFAPLFMALSGFAQNQALNTSVSNPYRSQKLGLSKNLNFALSAGRSESVFKSSSVVDISLELDLKYRLNSEFYIDFKPEAVFQSGYIQSVDANDNSQGRFVIHQAAGHWLPLSTSLLSMGALDQSQWHSPLLIGRQAFPGLRWTQRWYNQNSQRWTTFVEASIPTSSSLSPNTNEKEPIPSLTTGGLRWKFNPSNISSTEVRLNYFSYQKIPLSVSTASVLLGNTPRSEKINEVMDAFLYEYEGVEAASRFRWPLIGSFDFLLKADTIQNLKAPSDQNKAYLISSGFATRVDSTKEIETQGLYFRTEPDAIVAAYSSSDYFRANRVGYGAQVDLKWPKSKFKIGVSYTEAEVLFESPTQSREKNILIKLESNDVEI